MANPPTAYSTNTVAQRGYTKLLLGTEPFGGLIGSANTATYIVISARPAQVATTLNTEQGSGLSAVTTDLIDGQRFELTVEEDLNIAPPTVGMLVTLQNVFGGALGNAIAPFGTANISNGVFKIENNDLQSARKEIGQRVLVARAYALINSCNGGGNPNIGT